MLQRALEAADDHVAIDGLAEEAHGAGRLRALADPFLGEGGDEDDRYTALSRLELALQVEPAHARHLDVGDQARRVLQAGRGEEGLGRGEHAGLVTERT